MKKMNPKESPGSSRRSSRRRSSSEYSKPQIDYFEEFRHYPRPYNPDQPPSPTPPDPPQPNPPQPDPPQPDPPLHPFYSLDVDSRGNIIPAPQPSTSRNHKVTWNIQTNPFESSFPDTYIGREDTFAESRSTSPLPQYIYSARKFLAPSPPDLHLDRDSPELYQLPKEYFLRPTQERYLEKRPPPVRRFHKSPKRIPRAASPRRQPSDLMPTLSISPTSDRGDPQFSYSTSGRVRRQPAMNQLEEHERKIIIEFCHLLEKSKQLFSELRELPPYGHKQWHSYFGRTFDVYTKLWKFQQQHRSILDNNYGLKRWQIGEIASKIGQLYYHFYSRTSETAYLYEAFAFYYAIRGRSYYTQASKEDKCELMVKKLRYYARFIVTSILLKKVRLVFDLLQELDKQIIEYGKAYNPDDQSEWTVVVDEIKAFVRAEPVVTVLHPDGVPVMLTHRLTAQTTPPVERSPDMNLSLQEVLIIGSNSAQVKFSELTVDMFRIVQTLEREPCGDIQHTYDELPHQRLFPTPSVVNSKGYNLESVLNRGDNPHKYLLFKPTPSQILVYLANGCDDLPPNGVILLYISAEGHIVQPHKNSEDNGYDQGGLITTTKHDIQYKEITKDGKPVAPKYKEMQVLHPGDLYPFTRKPMFLIVDSNNSVIFNNVPRHFGQPLVILMSPLEVPASLNSSFHAAAAAERKADGSLFTLFLHCPLSAFCYCCGINSLSLKQWQKAQTYIDGFLTEASQIMTRTRPDNMYMVFMGDDFLRLLILRFIFCETLLRLHRAFRTRAQLTRCSPPLPDDLFEHPALVQFMLSLAANLQVRSYLHEPSNAAAAPPQNKE